MNELVKIEPREYGLEENKGTEIASSFLPVESEIAGLNKTYSELINSEITKELCERAKAFYTLLKKANGSNDKVHKVQKAYFLAGGKFADALKNKNKASIDVMKEKTLEIVNFYENQEKERIDKLSQVRADEIKPFLPEHSPEPIDLGYMSDDIWDNYLLGAKSSHQKRVDEAKRVEAERIASEKKAEEERLEKVRKQKLHNERKEALLPYWNFVPADKKDEDFSSFTELEWKECFDYSMNLKKEYDKKQAEIKAENERLRKEAELKAKKDYEAEKERERLAKIEAEKQAKIQAELKAKADAEKAEYERKLKAANDAKEKAEKEAEEKAKAEKLEKERLAKIEADRKEAERLASLAPEKEKIQKWIDSISIPDFDLSNISKEGQVVVNIINQKFEAFKKWAESQKESIK